MKIVSKNPLLVGTAVLTLVSAGLYGCKDFLSTNATPQGTLDAGTLSTAAFLAAMAILTVWVRG